MLNRQNWVNLILEGSTGSFLDHGKDIQLSLGELKEDDLHVAGFYGHEAMNELYSLDVVFSSDSADSSKVLESLGRDTCLRLPFPNGDRLIIGAIRVRKGARIGARSTLCAGADVGARTHAGRRADGLGRGGGHGVTDFKEKVTVALVPPALAAIKIAVKIFFNKNS